MNCVSFETWTGGKGEWARGLKMRLFFREERKAVNDGYVALGTAQRRDGADGAPAGGEKGRGRGGLSADGNLVEKGEKRRSGICLIRGVLIGN